MQSINGTCPTCRQPVFWVRDHTHGSDGAGWYAPLDPKPLELGRFDSVVYVAVSTSGAAAAITPQAHILHQCPLWAVEALIAQQGSMGFYTAEVLSIACPLSVCGAAPGMMCVTTRREAIMRPHGARAAKARGEDLD